MTAPVTYATTVGDLLAILTVFEPNTPVMLNSHDGPDYGSLEIGRGIFDWDAEPTLIVVNIE